MRQTDKLENFLIWRKVEILIGFCRAMCDKLKSFVVKGLVERGLKKMRRRMNVQGFFFFVYNMRKGLKEGLKKELFDVLLSVQS